MLLNRLPEPPISGAAAAAVIGSVYAAGRISGAATVQFAGTDSRPTVFAWPTPRPADAVSGTASDGAATLPWPFRNQFGRLAAPGP